VKGEHVGVVPGIAEYVEFFLSDQMAGIGGTLEAASLIPAPVEETAEVLAEFSEGKSLTAADLH
jgi:phosphate transport system substrate-binding protein